MFYKKPRRSLALPPPIPGIKKLYKLVSPYGPTGKHWLAKNWYRTGGNIEETVKGVQGDIEKWERSHGERLK